MNTQRLVPSASQIVRLSLVAILGLVGVAAAKAAEGSYAQRMACTPDAFRLCAAEMPDSDAVKVCMIAHKTSLSPSCRATFPRETASR